MKKEVTKEALAREAELWQAVKRRSRNSRSCPVGSESPENLSVAW